MVHQFKDNEFEKNFYDYENRISYNNFKSAYLLPELEERLYDCRYEFLETGKLETTLPAWEVLSNEMLHWQGAVEDYHFQAAELDPADVSKATFDQAARLLKALKQHFINNFSIANREKERYLGKLMQDRRNLYFSWLNQYHNESVADQVKKIYEKNQIIEYQGRLYQRIDPIFLDPAPKGIGIRSHFFAPRKYFLGRYYDTYRFNIGFIWFLTLCLYVILYYDLVGKLARSRLFRKKNS
jgi:hypothetical protein